MDARPSLNCVAYDGVSPVLLGPCTEARRGHALVGRVTLGAQAWLGASSVVRADGHFVRIGAAAHLGRAATVHIAHGRYPTVVGDRLTAGANTVIHACTLGDEVVLGDDVVVLDGAEIGDGAVFEPGSIVFPRAVLAGGWLYGGRPARALRALDAAERSARALAVRQHNVADLADGFWAEPSQRAAAAAPACFVASTARLQGPVQVGDGASVWYGCRLDARDGTIALGARCNVQDNSVLQAGSGTIALGDDTTVGHNVALAACSVGARCLVGIGSRIAPGTVLADDTFVAAGCHTEPGQVLEGGLIWAGRPARPLGALDDAKRRMILGIAEVYGQYARVLRAATGIP